LAHAGYLVDDQDLQGMTALHFAAERDDVANCKLLLQANANANLLEQSGFNPFHLAVAKGNLRVVEVLAETSQFSASASDRRALDLAVHSGNAEVCEHTSALKDTRGLHQRGSSGWTLLHVAADLGHADVCSVLIRHGGERLANALNEHGETALHLAAHRGHTGTCEAICSAKEFLAIEAKSVSGRTAVNVARLQRHTKTAAVISSHISPPWHST
jgi:ankyrin repeat protein